jgi:guanylate kinase
MSDHVVINDDLDRTVDELLTIIADEVAQRARR